jgi:hypothetical protein
VNKERGNLVKLTSVRNVGNHVIMTKIMNDGVNRKLPSLTPLNPVAQRQRLKTVSTVIASSMIEALEEEEHEGGVECQEIGEILRVEERESLIVAVDQIRAHIVDQTKNVKVLDLIIGAAWLMMQGWVWFLL